MPVTHGWKGLSLNGMLLIVPKDLVSKKGLPNILPFPNSCQSLGFFLGQCQCSFALFFRKHIQVAPEDLFKHYVPSIFPKLIEGI